jgi:hypothetical protein
MGKAWDGNSGSSSDQHLLGALQPELAYQCASFFAISPDTGLMAFIQGDIDRHRRGR